ncbi:MAG: peptidyl-prolyl cis-trans isomerase [Deltaproteobacteria bacterium]|jgi:peptidyl-prolyl cis-trans isomerase SurA
MGGKRNFEILVLFSVMSVMWWSPVVAEVCNRVVAVVNDEVITLHELNKKIKEMTGYAPADLELQNKERYLEARRRVLEFLIDERITQDKIQELGIHITEQELNRSVERIKSENQWTHEDLVAALKKDGLTYEKYQERMKKELERIKLIEFEVKSKIIIREEDIESYYEKHKKEFSTDNRVHLAAIFLVRRDSENEAETAQLLEGARKILARLKAGEDFAELAAEFSQGPGADEGGDLGKFRVDQLDPNLRSMVESMPVGEVSDPILMSNGVQMIKLLEREKGRTRSFQEVKDAIYRILYQEEVNRRYKAWIKDLRENCYTKIIF